MLVDFFNYILFIYPFMHMDGDESAYHRPHVEVREPPARVSPLSLPCGTPGSDSGCQAW